MELNPVVPAGPVWPARSHPEHTLHPPPPPPPPASPEQQQSSPLAATRPALVAAGPAGAVRRPGLSAQTPSCGVRPSLPGSEKSPSGIHPLLSRPASRDRADRRPEDKEAVPPPRRSPARESPPFLARGYPGLPLCAPYTAHSAAYHHLQLT